MASKKALFQINITKDGKTFPWFWQFRFRDESDVKHKKTLSNSKFKKLGEMVGKEDCILADFLFFYYKKSISSQKKGFLSKKRVCPFSLLVADYDILPECFDSFKEFRSFLKKKFPQAVVLKTPSNKAKALFLVEQDVKADSEKYGARCHALISILRDKRLLNFDHSVVALHKVFFTTQMIEEWQAQVNDLVIIGKVSELAKDAGWPETEKTTKNYSDEISFEDLLNKLDVQGFFEKVLIDDKGFTKSRKIEVEKSSDNAVIKRLQEKYREPLNRYSGEIPEVILTLGGRSRYFEDFLRIIIASPRLEKSAILPQRNIAQELDVSIGVIHRYLRILVKNRLIYDVDKNYLPGKKSKGYRAYGVLLALTKEHFATKKQSKGQLPNPSTIKIEDGEWNRKLFEYTNYFYSLEAYLAFVLEIPGIDKKKERKKQARSAWRSHEARNSGQI